MQLYFPRNKFITGKLTPLSPVNYKLALPNTVDNFNEVLRLTKLGLGQWTISNNVITLTINGSDFNLVEQLVKVNGIKPANKDLSYISSIVWHIKVSPTSTKKVAAGADEFKFEFFAHELTNDVQIKGFMLGDKYVPGNLELFKLTKPWEFTLYNDTVKTSLAVNMDNPGIQHTIGSQTALIELLKKIFNENRRTDLQNAVSLIDSWKTAPCKLPADLTIRIDYINWTIPPIISMRILSSKAWDVGISGFCKFSLNYQPLELLECERIQE